MKKTLLVIAFSVTVLFSFGQSLKKGNLVGLHVIDVTLKPDVTMEQYVAFYMNKAIPAYGKEFKGVKGYIVKGVRGENNNSFGILWVFESETARNQYFNNDGSFTAAGQAAADKLSAVAKEMEKLGTQASSSKYTDWVVQ